jgi:hypothetical protein
MKRLSLPKNQKAFILHTLINKKFISEQDVPMNGFRARVSELINDHGVDIQSEMVAFKNTFGHSSKYKKRFIPKKGIDKAIKVYNKIN